MKKEIEDLIEDLEILILQNEDDFDRGKGKYILREFISSIKSDSPCERKADSNNSNIKEVCEHRDWMCELRFSEGYDCTSCVHW